MNPTAFAHHLQLLLEKSQDPLISNVEFHKVLHTLPAMLKDTQVHVNRFVYFQCQGEGHCLHGSD